jgi:hypothetical protein
MCDDRNSLTPDELKILGIFKKLYWPHQTPCNQIQALATMFPGANANPTAFNSALNSLVVRGCINTQDNLTYCLTACGIQAICAAPSSGGAQCQ